MATWEEVGASFGNRAGELVELQGELRTARCPSCWGAEWISNADFAMELRGSMVQIPSRMGMVLRRTMGIADTVKIDSMPEDYGLSLHPRGGEDLEIVEEGEDCTATLAEAVEGPRDVQRITDGAWRERENEYPSLEAGDLSVTVYYSASNFFTGSDPPEDSGPIDITGSVYGDNLYVEYGPAWCNDDNRPTITDALVE